MQRKAVALGLAVAAIAGAIVTARWAQHWNTDLGIVPPLEAVPPIVVDPHTPRLAQRVVLVVVDGLGADEAHLPFLDELRQRGVAAVARVPYPTVSRPNYVTILTGVPPRDSGVRANRVEHDVLIDSVMTRAKTAGLRVATASDYGSIASLFPKPLFDHVLRADSLDELERKVRLDVAFVALLALDVDRAGHESGIGDEYRAAAADVDRMLRTVVGRLDLARDTVIVTADHGHVARGGHGGPERETSHVPLVLAGAGIVAGAHARDPGLVDVAPTIAALLGIPAPGHGEGRTLVEVLALDPAAAARRAAVDAARAPAIAIATVVDDDHPRIAWLVVAIALAGGAILLGLRAGVRSLVGLVGMAVIGVALPLITAGRLSPSYVPGLARLERYGAIAIAAAVGAQLVATWLAVRRGAAIVGIAALGIGASLASAAAVRAWFAPPQLEVPSPAAMVLVPTLDVAAAATCAALALALVGSLVKSRE